jgi:ankyrin repeat protein
MVDLVRLATEDRAAADAWLREAPSLSAATPWHALVFGDLDAVTRALDAGAIAPAVAAGPLDAVPLVYPCFSRYVQRDSPRTEALVETARRLLARGADANAILNLPAYPGNPFPVLYGATGYNDNPALATLLLDAGADPSDDESLYHSTEHEDLACVRLLLARGARVRGNTLKHMLDRESADGVRLLLDGGAEPAETNPRGETALHWAIRRGRSPDIVRLLVARGAPLEARRIDGRTAYALAVLFGRGDQAAALEDAGADTTVSEVDRYLAEYAQAERHGAPLPPPPALSDADSHLLPDLADAGHAAGVRALLAAGAGVNERGELGATPLHYVCWRGADALVAPLLARGADTTIEDATFKGTPPGWLLHGARYCQEPRGDYASALRALLAAGVPVTPREPTGRPEVDAILRERGLLP